MLDNLSRGRIICGFVRGIGAEYHSTGSIPISRMSGSTRRMISSSRRGRSPGRSPSMASISIFAMSICGAPLPDAASADLDSLARVERDRDLGVAPGSEISVPRHLLVRASWWCAISIAIAIRRANTAMKPMPGSSGWACPLYVAETDEKAREEAGRAAETLFNNFLRMPIEMLVPPGYTSQSSMKIS